MHSLRIEEVVKLPNGTTLGVPELGAVSRSIRKTDGTGDSSLHTSWVGPVTFSRPLPRVVWRNRGKEPSDFNVTHLLHVSERAKALIESFESNVHQFERIEFEDGQGCRQPDRYLLFVNTILDLIDPDSPGFVLQPFWIPMNDLIRKSRLHGATPDYDWLPRYDPNVRPRLQYLPNASAGHHLFKAKGTVHGRYVSNVLAAAIAEAGLTGVSTHPVPSEKYRPSE